MKRFYKIQIFVVILIFLISGCDNVLDTKVDMDRTDEMIQQDRGVLWDFGFKVYDNVENGFTVLDNNIFAAATDEAIQTSAESEARLFNEGSWNAFNNPADIYEEAFEGIRDANYYLEFSEDYKEFLAEDRDTLTDPTQYQRDIEEIGYMRAEVRVLRAYYYIELAKRYGGVPLVTETLDVDDDDIHIPRSSYDEIIEFAISEIDAVMDDLIEDWSDFDIGETGRINQAIAKAIKSRALLYAASPLNNDTNDQSKWEAAAEAAHDVIELNKFSLDDDYRALFLGDRTTTSPETIWARRLGDSNQMERQNYPIGTPGGNSGVTPSHNLVSAYEEAETPDPPPEPEPPIVDNLENFDLVYDRSDNTTITDPDGQWGDESVAERNESTAEWIIWHHPTWIGTFEMRAYHWPGAGPFHFKFEVSADAENWSEVEPEIEADEEHTNWARYFYTLEDLQNVEYVRVTFTDLERSWSQKIGQVVLTSPPPPPPGPPAGPFTDKDPRLNYTIVTDGSTWNDRKIEIWEGGQDDVEKSRSSKTGYYLKKFLDDDLNLQEDETKLRSWIIYRYAEILLNYAEAMNEAFGPDVDNGWGMTAREAVNAVRSRPGVELPDVEASSQSEMRERIKHERRIELAFEGHRYWDLIRWKDADTELNQPLLGIRAERESDDSITYHTVEVEDRVFETPKMYYFPIPQSEITKSGGVLDQNPEW